MHNSQIGVVHFAWGWLLMRQLPFSQASGTCGSTGCHAHGGLRADVGIGPYEKADATLFHSKNPHPMVGTGIFYYCTSLRQAEARAERVLHGIMRHRAAMVWTLLR